MATSFSFPKEQRTSKALFWTSLLNEPLFTLYSFIPFILYKHFGVGPFVIALLAMLKPMITILSFYWSANLKGRCRKIKPNILWAGFLMRAPFLLCPWIDSAWFIIFAAVNYMFFYRAGIPGWLELLKRNMEEKKRGKLFSFSSAASYAEGVVLALGFGALLDYNATCWKMLFPLASLIGLVSLLIQAKVPILVREEKIEKISLKTRVMRPWQDSFRLMREKPEFARFQWGFMFAGFGIMLIQPAIPLFAVDLLHINYLEMAAAISIAKGLGFSLFSPLWAKAMERKSLSSITVWIALFFGSFPLLLFLAPSHLGWFYFAWFVYGIAQGGSHLVWNLSGPVFAGQEESSRYTGVSVAFAGLRGAVSPPLGGVLTACFGPLSAFFLGALFCLYSALFLFSKEKTFVGKKPSSV